MEGGKGRRNCYDSVIISKIKEIISKRKWRWAVKVYGCRCVQRTASEGVGVPLWTAVQFDSPSKLKHSIILEPAIPFASAYLREINRHISRRTGKATSTAALCTLAQHCKQPICPSKDERASVLLSVHTAEYISGSGGRAVSVLGTVRHPEHHARSKKAIIKDQLPSYLHEMMVFDKSLE